MSAPVKVFDHAHMSQQIGVACESYRSKLPWMAVWQVPGQTGYTVGYFKNRRNAKAAVRKRHSAEQRKAVR